MQTVTRNSNDAVHAEEDAHVGFDFTIIWRHAAPACERRFQGSTGFAKRMALLGMLKVLMRPEGANQHRGKLRGSYLLHLPAAAVYRKNVA